ncbi:hypothetical protein C8J27_106223 [Rhodobacter aestuarii]|uniref:Cadmium carbonic anhydrase repeat-containing protein n=1 Tax=Rhodobacter aestuarii TaxID=453582 RepID=A0A1N7MAR0_9RHOB|nr:delta-class carbonic anhydrase [Rhodobacter aestuarii]PTV94954.1 hypothetical protein C8J27_106223 [Rhodobacter aestuarii]SIS83059.1 hypothetical protein SAMN05421580_105223 [Rhodobacter aestuarii]
MRKLTTALTLSTSFVMMIGATGAFAESHGEAASAEHGAMASHGAVGDDVIAAQRDALYAATVGRGFGPQAPRDLSFTEGTNPIDFAAAPPSAEMNLCNIHFHEGAEHRGGEFTTYAGNGDGAGYGSGYIYDGMLSDAELAPYAHAVGATEHGALEPGDTIEIHYVYSSAEVKPGPTLGSCLSEAVGNPQLRVEAYVYVVVNDDSAADLTELNTVTRVGGKWQAPKVPAGAGEPITYDGSTTGPTYNEKGSPFQVTWSVHPKVTKVSIASVGAWLADNPFDEDHAHGVRTLVEEPALLSKIN